MINHRPHVQKLAGYVCVCIRGKEKGRDKEFVAVHGYKLPNRCVKNAETKNYNSQRRKINS